MKIPKDLTTVPQGGAWEIRVPETSHVIRESHINNFKSAIRRHAEDNNLPWAGSGAVDYGLDLWCQQHPTAACLDTEKPERVFTVDDLSRFAKSMTAWVSKVATGEAAWVSQEEAERRAEICTICPHNIRVSCGWCGGPVSAIVNMMGGRRTSSDEKLQSCEKCLCTLRAKVHMPLDTLDRSGIDWPTWCWQRP